MARTMFPNSASSQFFICVTDTPHLDGQYAGFGKAIDQESIDVAIDISKVDTTFVGGYDDVPVSAIVIKTISKLED
jgi:peptidyl-prolyl cis-trans isomerase B (cyclophilin B)